MTWRLLGLFSQLVDTPFYAELRTRQQLGYIVGSSIAESEGVRGLVFSVQSSALPPPELEARVDGFLRGFRGTLAAMPEAELSAYREALAVQVSDVDKPKPKPNPNPNHNHNPRRAGLRCRQA